MEAARRAAVVICVFTLLLCVPKRANALAGQCPDRCICKWKGNKQTVECVSASLTAIPSNLDAGTQVLDLSSNQMKTPPGRAFASLGLINLQRIYLSK